MTSINNQNCTVIGELLSGYIDDELTQQNSQRVQLHLETCAACHKLHDELTAVKAQLRQLSFPKADEALLDEIENDLFSRTAASFGWLLLTGGFTIVLAAGFYVFFSNPDVPRIVRFFHGFVLLGGLGLFLSVLRQRLLSYKHDKYKKVKL